VRKHMGVDFGLHFSCTSTVGGDWPELYEAAIEQTKLAEQLGYSAAVVSEHHFMENGWVPSPTVLAGALAGATENIAVGTDIIILPLHHPITIAEDILVLDNLTRGKVICGVGMGGEPVEFDIFNVPIKQRVSRSEEAMQLIRLLMGEEDVHFDGRYHQVEGITVTPRPVQKPCPPIWYGAISEPGARRAAKFADALIMGPTPHIEKLKRMKDAYIDELESQGKDPSEGRTILRRECYIAADTDTAWKEGWEALKYQTSRIYTNFPPDGSEEAFREFAKGRYVWGDPERFLEEIERYVDATGTDLILWRIQLPGLAQDKVYEATRLLGEKVLPHVQ
jgi:alkanesulfonate monooxygenase SsuD/methylene tetrahydromethanopterin reductase-like flavin-dependent oxidoreductase (luciferase family)